MRKIQPNSRKIGKKSVYLNQQSEIDAIARHLNKLYANQLELYRENTQLRERIDLLEGHIIASQGNYEEADVEGYGLHFGSPAD